MTITIKTKRKNTNYLKFCLFLNIIENNRTTNVLNKKKITINFYFYFSFVSQDIESVIKILSRFPYTEAWLWKLTSMLENMEMEWSKLPLPFSNSNKYVVCMCLGLRILIKPIKFLINFLKLFALTRIIQVVTFVLGIVYFYHNSRIIANFKVKGFAK